MCRQLFLMTAVLLLAGGIACADREAPAAAVPAGEPQTAPRQDGELTADDVMRRAAEAYKKMDTYYERSTLTRSIQVGDQRLDRTIHVTTAFRRPGTLKINLSGDEEAVLHLEEGTLTVYSPRDNQYTRQENVDLKKLTGALEYPLPAAALSDDPYRMLREENVTMRPMRTSELNGRRVYEVGYARGEDVDVTYFFDAERYYLAGIAARIAVPEEQGEGAMQLRMIADSVLIDELPQVAEGQEEQIFAFAPPEDAVPLQPSQPDVPTVALKGQAAPQFTLPDLEGREIRLQDLRGKVVVLDFWATWCPPCKEQMPALESIAEEYDDNDEFVYYAINEGETPEVIQAFLEQTGADVPVLLARGTDVSARYNLVGIPTIFIIDREGIVREVHVGLTNEQTLRRDIDRVLNGNAATG